MLIGILLKTVLNEQVINGKDGDQTLLFREKLSQWFFNSNFQRTFRRIDKLHVFESETNAKIGLETFDVKLILYRKIK